jgi:isopentenyl-diphosphate delta-isomerase
MTATLTTTALATDSAQTSQTTALATIELDGYDEEQIRLMEERCILVTPDDEAYGDVSKKTCALSQKMPQRMH